MNIVRKFRKNISLSMVNLAGLSVVLASLLLSAAYIGRELSYDCHHTNANRIVRLSLQLDDEPVDGRILGSALDDVLLQIPEVERVVKMFKVQTAVVAYGGRKDVVSDLYMVNRDFLQVFDVPLLLGVKDDVLQERGKVLVSESFANQLFGEFNADKIQASEITIDGRSCFISGVFKDMPSTSHFHSDILMYRPDQMEAYTYTYLLLRDKTVIHELAHKITTLAEQKELFRPSIPHAILMPLTDIHLYSHNLIEMSINGNIYYIYLIVGANLLLLAVVLFNIWLNASLIFSYNRRYYQILRLHGATPFAVIKDGALLALFWGVPATILGVSVAYVAQLFGLVQGQISLVYAVVFCFTLLLLIITVSIIPVLTSISSTLFLNTDRDLKPTNFSYSNVKWMLTIQYAVVMVVVAIAFGINKQMNFVKDMQVGGSDQSMLVMGDQPEEVMEKYHLLKEELLKHAEVTSTTTCFQLPGDAIRDVMRVRRENSMDWAQLPIIVVGEGFIPFFGIGIAAGQAFENSKYDYQAERSMLIDRIQHRNLSEHVEEYIINKKALAKLGFSTANEAIGEVLVIEHGMIDYFQRGVIVGVAEDFNYTGLYEETIPLLMLQRNMFQFYIMVKLDSDRIVQARSVFEKVWNEVNPDYPASYVFMNDVFTRMYSNEINAERLMYIFSLLCFWIADLGLIVFVAFIIRRRTKEIAIHKVHGASVGYVIRMLNMSFIRFIVLAFVVAVPIAWYVMHYWLERFAYRTSLDWWLFVAAGGTVLLISIVSVSIQSWRAAIKNPVTAIKKS